MKTLTLMAVWCLMLGMGASGFAALPLPDIPLDPVRPVPETGSTLALLGSAMIGIAGLRYWLKRKKS